MRFFFVTPFTLFSVKLGLWHSLNHWSYRRGCCYFSDPKIHLDLWIFFYHRIFYRKYLATIFVRNPKYFRSQKYVGPNEIFESKNLLYLTFLPVSYHLPLHPNNCEDNLTWWSLHSLCIQGRILFWHTLSLSLLSPYSPNRKINKWRIKEKDKIQL